MREMNNRSTQTFSAQAPIEMDIGQLNELAVRGLVRMFDAQKQLFCFTLKPDRAGVMIQEGISRRYTIMSLLGLQRREWLGQPSPVEIKPVLEGLLRETSWIDNIGDLGLVLWLCALAVPEQLSETCGRLDVANALKRFPTDHTMELAWFLSGVSHIALASLPKEHPAVTELSMKCYERLKANQGKHGYFGHLRRNSSWAGMARGHIGSFADQVYPIYALSKFADAYKVPAALQMANSCADAICRAQGPLGQWWWHYDSVTGKVVERYPVYSVHQHGMAPMALLAIGKAARRELTSAIQKGLGWISGGNELGRSLRDSSSNVIWRSMDPAWYQRRLSVAKSLLGQEDNFEPKGNLKMNLECRPYELGWLLYAFAGSTPARAGAC